MPREKEHESDADRQRAYRERKRNAEGNVTPSNVTAEEEGVTFQEPAVTNQVEVEPYTVEELIAGARSGRIELSDDDEQAIRDHFGYAKSEKRTLQERDEAALSMVAGAVRMTRVGANGVEEPTGPAGLSLVAFPNQVPGDLTPTPEERAKLG